MLTDLLTTDDLQKFKKELLAGIRDLLAEDSRPNNMKMLKSAEVKKLLRISTGTLQNLRVTGVLPYTKIGGVFFYSAADIQRMLEENRVTKSK